jgi:hypothetical protein
MRLPGGRREPLHGSSGRRYFVLHDVGSEGRARELAAVPHAALHGDLEPLARAVLRSAYKRGPAALRELIDFGEVDASVAGDGLARLVEASCGRYQGLLQLRHGDTGGRRDVTKMHECPLNFLIW